MVGGLCGMRSAGVWFDAERLAPLPHASRITYHVSQPLPHQDVPVAVVVALVEAAGGFVVDGDHEADDVVALVAGIVLGMAHEKRADSLAAEPREDSDVEDPAFDLPGDQVP